MFILELGNKSYNVINISEEYQFGNNQLRFTIQLDSLVSVKEIGTEVKENISTLAFKQGGDVFRYGAYTSLVNVTRTLPSMDVSVVVSDSIVPESNDLEYVGGW